MTDHFQQIYAQQADQYDRMVSHEDYQGNILPALQAIRPLKDLEVIEFGAGTGRVTRLLVPHVRHIWACDLSRHMLITARDRLPEAVSLIVGDNRQMPVRSECADLVIAGWSFGHATGWYQDRWADEIGLALDEMARIMRPDGTRVILETLGTGNQTPIAPNETLAAYYHWLETERGFQRTWVRTDLKFESIDAAVQGTRFFFGDAFADQVRREGWSTIPECTGIWWRSGR
ncbi:MAG: methyltransferase domain-containing protein [Anaerolineae bacterium]|jgi:ubiquinone/menaquinone biosynthesis C-methylase UbiE|nr:methyltransferase domain-containing protein [Anaerolineae bacterium]